MDTRLGIFWCSILIFESVDQVVKYVIKSFRKASVLLDGKARRLCTIVLSSLVSIRIKWALTIHPESIEYTTR